MPASVCAAAGAHGRCQTPPKQPQLFTACCRRKLQEFPPRALSSTIQGLATLKYRPDPGFMAALVEAMDRELDNFTWLVGENERNGGNGNGDGMLMGVGRF